jgi:hypothetical protein
MSNEPTPQSAPSDISEAFEALRREVSLSRHAVEGLTAARERVPDYSTPLGQIIDALKRTLASLDRIEKSPAVQLTPDAMALKIHQSSATARADDARLIRETSDAMVRSVGTMDQIVERGRAAKEQGQNLIYAAVGGVLFAFLLLLALVGFKSAFASDAEAPRTAAVKSGTSAVAVRTDSKR